MHFYHRNVIYNYTLSPARRASCPAGAALSILAPAPVGAGLGRKRSLSKMPTRAVCSSAASFGAAREMRLVIVAHEKDLERPRGAGLGAAPAHRGRAAQRGQALPPDPGSPAQQHRRPDPAGVDRVPDRRRGQGGGAHRPRDRALREHTFASSVENNGVLAALVNLLLARDRAGEAERWVQQLLQRRSRLCASRPRSSSGGAPRPSSRAGRRC